MMTAEQARALIPSASLQELLEEIELAIGSSARAGNTTVRYDGRNKPGFAGYVNKMAINGALHAATTTPTDATFHKLADQLREAGYGLKFKASYSRDFADGDCAHLIISW